MPPKAGPKDKQADQAAKEYLEQLAMVRKQCDGYERLIHIGSEQLQRSQLEQTSIKKKIVELNDKFKQEDGLTATMTHDMYRVYTTVQHQLLEKIEQHQSTIRTLRVDLEEARNSLERTKAEKDAICADKTRQINEQKQKMEEMAIAFGVKLKETLEQMSQHIQGERHHAV